MKILHCSPVRCTAQKQVYTKKNNWAPRLQSERICFYHSAPSAHCGPAALRDNASRICENCAMMMLVTHVNCCCRALCSIHGPPAILGPCSMRPHFNYTLFAVYIITIISWGDLIVAFAPADCPAADAFSAWRNVPDDDDEKLTVTIVCVNRIVCAARDVRVSQWLSHSHGYNCYFQINKNIYLGYGFYYRNTDTQTQIIIAIYGYINLFCIFHFRYIFSSIFDEFIVNICIVYY